jgi:hypothetical protein|tara:strand:- start:2116 stop:2508 length:393 start_codon:yes stop_codon:yes gene_type:complete
MATKENKKNIYLLLGLGIIGFVAYKKWAESQKEKQLATESAGGVTFNPIEAAKQDAEFKSYVEHLQEKLNNAIKKMIPPDGNLVKPDFYPLIVDGFIGNKTLQAIETVFGADVLPITEKKTVKWLVENFK